MVRLACACGAVQLTLASAPFLAVDCLCASCQAAGDALAARAPRPILDAYGGTRFGLVRKDRAQLASGGAHLKAHSTSSTSRTRRLIASCCGTPVCLALPDAHWVSLYGALWPSGAAPAPRLRTMTRDAATPPPNDGVPNARTHTLAFYATLFRVWAEMGFRTPALPWLDAAEPFGPTGAPSNRSV